MKTLVLKRVEFMPRDLSPGVLYVSEEYGVAGHLCACGCGNKVIVPLGPTEWTFHEKAGRPTLRPSIGNWQLPCRSHYVITNGRIEWAGAWSEDAVIAGRRAEEARRVAYYAKLDRDRGFWHRLWKRILKIIGRN
ncbi:hypothetical protein DES32_0653 [Methylovirgula ligni]|uniref:Uncharacterized protein n=2 Tax=Methylovirgula ligni TaxID=569860 RepID=A0A3D9Z2Q8_9HYPH|nr:hypothetical protein DES32_0653 [Methylovirgula ligni]